MTASGDSAVTRFHPPPPTVWGPGAVDELPAVLERRNEGAVLIISDPGVVDAGIVSTVAEALPVEPRVVDDVEPNPSRETVDRLGGDVADAELVVAVGGGSVMDAAKAAVALGTVTASGTSQPLDVLRERAVADPVANPDAKVPLGLIPTTAGTGSETGHWAVISDDDRAEKLSVGHRVMKAEFVVLDPTLTTTLPPGLTASTGFDVIAHALEALVAQGRTPLTQPMAAAAYRRAVSELPTVVETGDSIEARTAMLAASYLAGLAMNNAGLGAVHGISHAIGGLYGTPHGHTNALLLPPVVRRNAARSDSAHAIYAGLTDHDGVPGGTLAERLLTLRRAVGLDRALPGLPSDPDWQRVAERAVANVNTASNPVAVTETDVVEICRETFA